MIDVENINNFDSQIECQRKTLKELQVTFFGKWGTLQKNEARKSPIIIKIKQAIIKVELEIRDLRSQQLDLNTKRKEYLCMAEHQARPSPKF